VTMPRIKVGSKSVVSLIYIVKILMWRSCLHAAVKDAVRLVMLVYPRGISNGTGSWCKLLNDLSVFCLDSIISKVLLNATSPFTVDMNEIWGAQKPSLFFFRQWPLVLCPVL
jgi:hypothetical protein